MPRRLSAAPSSPNQSDANSDPSMEEEVGGSSEEGFPNPLLGEPDEEPPSAACEGSAVLGTKLVNLGCTLRWNAPLTDPETSELVRDLSAVLAKHDAPDLPWAEEVSLAATLGGIVFRRVAEERAQAAAAAINPQPPEKEGVPGDMSSVGKEGVRQNGTGPQVGFPGSRSEAADLLS